MYQWKQLIIASCQELGTFALVRYGPPQPYKQSIGRVACNRYFDSSHVF